MDCGKFREYINESLPNINLSGAEAEHFKICDACAKSFEEAKHAAEIINRAENPRHSEERIQNVLNKTIRNTRISIIRIAIPVAASIIIVLAVFLAGGFDGNTDKPGPMTPLAEKPDKEIINIFKKHDKAFGKLTWKEIQDKQDRGFGDPKGSNDKPGKPSQIDIYTITNKLKAIEGQCKFAPRSIGGKFSFDYGYYAKEIKTVFLVYHSADKKNLNILQKKQDDKHRKSGICESIKIDGIGPLSYFRFYSNSLEITMISKYLTPNELAQLSKTMVNVE